MRRRVLVFWELAGFLWTAAAGTLLHFTYDWSGGSKIAAAFSAVNESTWEHMKLLFVPLFLFTVVQVAFLGRTYPNLLAVRAVAALTGLALPVRLQILIVLVFRCRQNNTSGVDLHTTLFSPTL